MTQRVAQITEQVKALATEEYKELLGWMLENDLSNYDTWDEQMLRDTEPGGGLDKLCRQAEADFDAGECVSLDEFLNLP